MNNRLINTKVAGGGGGGCTDIVDNYDPFEDGLALYQLNGDATDISTNYPATSTTGITWGTSGVFGTSASYNGSTSKIRLPSSLATAVGSNDFSISTWVYLDTMPSSFYSLATLQDVWYYYIFIAADGSVRTYNQNVQVNSATGLVTTGQWYHIVATLSSTSGKNVYLNGVNVASSSNTSNCNAFTNGHTALGYYQSNSTVQYILDGKIDQTRFINKALTPLEVEALYTEELCICDGTVDTLQVLGDTSCIAAYQLDGNANDLSGNYSGEPNNVSYGVGEFDLAGVFNGSSSIITNSNQVIPNGASSISFWYNNNGLNGANYIIGNGVATASKGITSTFGSDRFGVFIGKGTTAPAIEFSSTNTFSNSSWYNVTITWDGTTSTNAVKLYVNGQLEGQGTSNTSSAGIGSYSSFGIGGVNGGAYAAGSIDQVRIFNKALSAGEVTTLYNETACDALACGGTTNTLDILSDGSCVAAYPLDGSPLDLSGNYNGVQTDVTYPVGKFDLAGSFNGTSSYVELPSGIIPSNNFSFSLWFKTNDITTSQYILGFRNTLKTYILLNATSNGSIRAVAGQNLTVDSASVVSANTWYHLSVTQSSTSGVTVYLNNSVVASNPSYTGDLVIVTGKNLIGANYGTSLGGVFNGSIDQVRVFDKALSAGEVTTLYNETACN